MGKVRRKKVSIPAKETVFCCTCGKLKRRCINCVCVRNKRVCKKCNADKCSNRSGNEDGKGGRRMREGSVGRESREVLKIRNVAGDGNCFFRCLSQALYENEDRHVEIRMKVVNTMREHKDHFGMLIPNKFEEYLAMKSKSSGERITWATDNEVFGASYALEADIYIYAKPGRKWEWFRFSVYKECDHRRKYFMIRYIRSHYQLLIGKRRPCTCENEQNNLVEWSIQETEAASMDQGRCNRNREKDSQEDSRISTEVGRNIGRVQMPTDPNQEGAPSKGVVERAYEEIIHYKQFNMFTPAGGKALGIIMREKIKLLNEIEVGAPTAHLAMKKLMIMPKLLLQKTHIKAKTKENNEAFNRRADLWLQGKLELLLDEARAIQGRLVNNPRKRSSESTAKMFRMKMERGSVRQASRLINKNEMQGILPLNDTNMQKLIDKHPKGEEPSPSTLLTGDQQIMHQTVYSAITGDMVRKAAIETNGAAGPSGMDASTWKRILTSRKNSAEAAELRAAIASLARKLCSEACEHIEPLTACRLIPARKAPEGIRPIGVGEVLRRIIGRCVMKVAKKDVMMAAGNLQLCAGQQAGAEAAIHAMRVIYNEEKCEAVLLVDATNAFNTLNRKAMLHNIAIQCPILANFVKNTYTHDSRLILTERGEISSKEGTTQGDPIAMAIYAIGLSSLQKKTSFSETGAKQAAFADDLIGGGELVALKKWWEAILQHGPPLGYYPNAKKSYLVVKPGKEEEARRKFEGTNIMITAGERHLGAVIGSQAVKHEYVKKAVEEWVQEISALSEIAKTEPHAAYTNFVFSTKMRWNYVMRTIPGIKQLLKPLEECIREQLIPSLLKYKVNGQQRDLLALPARLGGMGIINPMNMVEDEYNNSVKLTGPLVEMIVQQNAEGEVNTEEINAIKKRIAKERETKQRQELARLENCIQQPKQKRRLKMNQEKGASNWLTSLPIRECGFSLNKQEFQDAVAIRYGWRVPNLPQRCVCGESFNKDHAMICKRGGFVTLRHNELRDITYDMMNEVCKDARREPPLINLSGEKFKYRTANTSDNARLDVAARGFWTSGEMAFFDIRVFDPTASSYMDRNLITAHRLQETTKKREYEQRVTDVEHGSFTPLIFTIAGGMSELTQTCYNRLADKLSEKRGQSRSVTVAWMRTRISFSLLRSAILCLRGTRVNPLRIRDLTDTDLETAVAEGRIATNPVGD